MGLDMYLYADKYVSRKDYNIRIGEYDYATNEEFDTIISAVGAEGIVDSEWSGLTVSVPVGYWRKANAIHNWIVENCAGGVDECQEIPMPTSKVLELITICESVLSEKSLAMKLLPPQSGFFFGSTEIDEWYFKDLERTVSILQKVLEAADRNEIDGITYRASW